MAAILLDKLWQAHRIASAGDGRDLIHIDRILLHGLSGARALAEVAGKGARVRNPELVFATPDHGVSTAPGRTAETFPAGASGVAMLREGGRRHDIRLFDPGEVGQGIVHVMAPELGLALPGLSIICGDSHTCTQRGLAHSPLGWGVRNSRTRWRPRSFGSPSRAPCACAAMGVS